MTVHTHGTTGGAEHPADVAQQETSRVAEEATQQARGLANQVRDQVSTQAAQQKSRAAEQLRSLGDGLQEMAQSGGPGPAQDIVSEIASRARMLSDYVENHEPTDLLDELRSFARQRPMLFLGGAAVAGALLGRLSRGVVSAATGGSSSGQSGQALPSGGYESGTYASGTYASGTTSYGPAGDVAGATASPYGTSTGVGATAGTGLEDDARLGALGTTTTTTTTGFDDPPRASGTSGSFHG